MSTELFINKAILPFLVWSLVCLPLLGIILVAYDKLKQPKPQEHLQVRLSCSLDEFDAEIARLRGILDAYMPYDVQVEAEIVAENYLRELQKGEKE